MRQSNHFDFRKIPVVKVMYVDGRPINIRYNGTWAEACAAFIKSIQQDMMKVKYPLLDDVENQHEAAPGAGVAHDVL